MTNCSFCNQDITPLRQMHGYHCSKICHICEITVSKFCLTNLCKTCEVGCNRKDLQIERNLSRSRLKEVLCK